MLICNRCGREEGSRYVFYEVDRQDRRDKFGIFCMQCSVELVDELKGKLEWFRIAGSWRGYIHPKARAELEKEGFIHLKRNSQYIEIKRVKI